MNPVQRSDAAKRLLVEVEGDIPYDEGHDKAVKMRLALEVIRLREETREIKWGGRN